MITVWRDATTPDESFSGREHNIGYFFPLTLRYSSICDKPKTRNSFPIGNSQGIRISKLLLQKYGFIDRLVLEETDKGILIRKPDEDSQFSWEDTFKAMAQEEEDWSDLDVTLMDGLANDDA